MLHAIWGLVTDVGGYWYTKAFEWWQYKDPRAALLEALDEATTFEQWEAIALALDKLLELDVWRETQPDKVYDYKLIRERLESLSEAQAEQDAAGLVSLLRAGLVRNLGNITAGPLFHQAFSGTKLLIDQYITQMCLAIEHIAALPAPAHAADGWTPQAKMDLMHDTRQAFGRSTLVLQGGAIFGLSHLGVVKALHLRGLLPRIIIGTGTGALIAALVCIHTEDELLDFLNGDGVDLTAFSRQNRSRSPERKRPNLHDDGLKSLIPDDLSSPVQAIIRRVRRYFREGYFLDVNVLESCVRANLGNMTFEEAYVRTKRVLNITVAPSRSPTGTVDGGFPDSTGSRSGGGMPTLLNYLTAPHVLIWSAAVASNTSSTNLYRPATLYCKDEHGAIVPWRLARGMTFHSYRAAPAAAAAQGRDSPLARVAELFNVNHFIVAQARPLIAPFLDLRGPSDDGAGSGPHHHRPARPSALSLPGAALLSPLLRLLAGEIQHRVAQLDALGLLSPGTRRFLLDDPIPGPHITLVPSMTLGDLGTLLEARPTRDALDHWILRGERAVWPAVAALRIRAAVEVELDRAYQLVRRRRPLEIESAQRRHER